MDTNKMREQFEAWADAEGYVMDCIWGGDGNHGYEDEDTQYAWGLFQIAWKASRETVVVELPRPYKSAPPYACYEGGWNDMRVEAVDVIEAQGLKVAP